MTSGLQCGVLELSISDGGAAAARYAVRKRRYLDTANLCDAAAFTFVPVIFEAEGGLGRDAAALIGGLAQAAARLTSETAELRAELMLQSLSITLQRANALAIARRATGAQPALCAPLAAAHVQLSFAAAVAADPNVPGAVSAAAPSVASLACTTSGPPCPLAAPPAAPPVLAAGACTVLQTC